MKKYIIFLIVLFAQIALYAQEYYPEGAKWAEIRLDTLKYDSWYSKVGDEWVPNYETVEYYVKGECNGGYRDYYKLVYTNGPEWSDSLTLLISESQYGIEVSVAVFDENVASFPPGWAYGFGNWKVGTTLSYQTIDGANTPSLPPAGIREFGTIAEIKEAYFGGVCPLKYVDLNGTRLINGIGVTEWNDGECIFGPVDPYFCYYAMSSDPKERHYRSMLVHFERNGEVLYDVWPDKVSSLNIVHSSKPKQNDALYDLQGRKVNSQLEQKGLYILNGKKVAVK